MLRGRSTPQITEQRSKSRVHVPPSRSWSPSSMMRAIVLLSCTFLVVVDFEVVTSMSLDRLAVDRYNEIRSDKPQFEIHDNDRSDIVVEGLEVEAVPANGETDLYVLSPAASERDSVDRNTIESDQGESISGDMLMMESNDVPIVQVARLPAIVEKDKMRAEKVDTNKSDSSSDETDDGESDDEPIKQVFKNDKDIEDMAEENNAKENTESEEVNEAKENAENEPESVVEIISEVVDEVEKEIETELSDDESEDTEADEVKKTNEEEKAKWEATVEKLEEEGSEKDEDDSDVELDEAAAVMEEILPEEVVEVMAVADVGDSSSEEKEILEKEKEEGNIKEKITSESTQDLQKVTKPKKEQVNSIEGEKKNERDTPKGQNEDSKPLENDRNILEENQMKETAEESISQTTEKIKVNEVNEVEDVKEELVIEEEMATPVGETDKQMEKEPINAANMQLADNSSAQTEQLTSENNKNVEKEEQDEASTEQSSLETTEIVQSDSNTDKTKDNEVLEESVMAESVSDLEKEEQTMEQMENTDAESLPIKDEEMEKQDSKDGEMDANELDSAAVKPMEPINTSGNNEIVPALQELQPLDLNEMANKNEETTEKLLENLNTPVENLPQKPEEETSETSAPLAETATMLTTILLMPTTQHDAEKEPLILEQQLQEKFPVIVDQEKEQEKQKDAPPAVEQQKENEQQMTQQQEENAPIEATSEDSPHNEMQIADSEAANDALETTQQLTIASSTQKPQIADSALNYVNATIAPPPPHSETVQQAQQWQNTTANDKNSVPPFSSQLRRYDGAQVWRIVVQNDRDRRLADELQTKYDAQLWKEVKQEVDYLLKPQLLAAAEKHIRSANLSRIVLIDNLQQVIEVENPPLDELADADNDKGHRLTWQAYHRLADIHEYFDYLAKTYPEICAVETIGYSVQRRPLKVLKISNGNAGNPGVWIDGGMHAREWISPASVTYVANQLAEGWDGLPSYMQNINWYIHAVANPDGYEYTHTTDRLWRKNLRSHGRQCPGVDLNRNFGFKWGGKGTSANPCSQVYRGSKAFSEPETFYISKFISSFPRDTFQAYISFHSYGQYILYPWGYDYLLTSDRVDLDRIARSAATTITRSTGAKYTVGSSAITLYPAAGGSDDWAKGIANIKYTYTVEMGDSGRYGFILPANQIETNGRDAYTFVQTVARAVSRDARKRAMKLK